MTIFKKQWTQKEDDLMKYLIGLNGCPKWSNIAN